MRLKLGFESRNVMQLLTRWGAELRSIFFLGDEDCAVKQWSFSLSDLGSLTAGITFSNLDIIKSEYIHVGNFCSWELSFTVQPSADCSNLFINISPSLGLPTPRPGTHVGCGRIYSMLGGHLGAAALEVPAQVLMDDYRLLLRSGIYASNILFNTVAGTVPVGMNLQGFYFTKDLPRR